MTGLTAMDKLLFWLGLGAAQKGAGSKPTKDRHPVVSVVVGILIAVLIAAAAFILLVSHSEAYAKQLGQLMIQSLHAPEMLLRFDVSRSPHQNESWLIAPAAWRETFSKQASHFMLLCMCRIVSDPINS
jgi:hypothetical protein